MTHVITTACIDVKDGACVQCCPVDCIYEGARTLYIHPDECIDCGICVSACPTQAIYEVFRLPPALARYTDINREFFTDAVSALGSPGGAADVGPVACDHPLIAQELPPPTVLNGPRVPRAKGAADARDHPPLLR